MASNIGKQGFLSKKITVLFLEKQKKSLIKD